MVFGVFKPAEQIINQKRKSVCRRGNVGDSIFSSHTNTAFPKVSWIINQPHSHDAVSLQQILVVIGIKSHKGIISLDGIPHFQNFLHGSKDMFSLNNSRNLFLRKRIPLNSQRTADCLHAVYLTEFYAIFLFHADCKPLQLGRYVRDKINCIGTNRKRRRIHTIIISEKAFFV